MIPVNVQVSPFYSAAKDEIVKPARNLAVSEYFVLKWMPRLGHLASTIVLYLRSKALDIPANEVTLQLRRAEICAAIGCSDSTLYRELKDNETLKHFVHVEDRFIQNEKGHIRRVECIYLVRMDDPVVPEDEVLVQAIVTAREAAERAISAQPQRKVIMREDLSRQNDGIGSERECAPVDIKMTGHMSPVKMTGHDSESYVYKQEQVTVTPPGGRKDARPAGPEGGNGPALHVSSEALEEWRRQTEELARHSAKECGDQNSIGYHILAWNHARKLDKQQSTRAHTNALFDILRDLAQRHEQTGKPQGAAWTRRTRKFFDEMGAPLLSRSEQEEALEIRRILAETLLMQDQAE